MDVRMVSYADNHEDVLLQRALPADAGGFYIDVGAYDPTMHSVTRHFYDRGWRGINVEPNPAPFRRLHAERARDVNLNLGLSDRAGTLTIYEAPDACWSVDKDLLTGWFGADRSSIVERTIRVRTLADVCDEHVPAGATISFLKVDVEGHEHEVLRGGDWSRWRPRVVLVEAGDQARWEPILLSNRYQFAFFDGVNRFYVREEDPSLLPILSYPANPGDRYAIHGYMARIVELEAQVGRLGGCSPATLKLASWMHRIGNASPRLKRMARPIVRRLAS